MENNLATFCRIPYTNTEKFGEIVYFRENNFRQERKKSKVGIELDHHFQEWGNAILRAAVIIVVLFFFCWPMRLMGSSMEPTMGDGEIVLMNRFAAMQGHYEKGDIVMFHYYDAEGDKTLVKRIIATEGDTIRILDEGVEVNGTIIEEAYVSGETDGLVDMTVPRGTVFLMGDNRKTSFDSRNMGAIPCEDLKGKVFFRIYPFWKFGKIA